MKNKAKTTSVFLKPEFWMTLVTSVSGILLAFGVITPDQSGGIAKYAPNLIGALLSLVSTSKFVTTQQEARIEVFKALCGARMQRTGGVSAQSSDTYEDQIIDMARAAGL